MRSSRHVASIVELLIKPAIPLVYLFLIDLFINFRVHVFQFVFPNQLIHSVKAKNIFYFWKNVGDGVTVRPTSSHDKVRHLKKMKSKEWMKEKEKKKRKEKKLLQVHDGERGFELWRFRIFFIFIFEHHHIGKNIWIFFSEIYFTPLFLDQRRFVVSSTSWFECPLSCPVSSRISILRPHTLLTEKWKKIKNIWIWHSYFY